MIQPFKLSDHVVAINGQYLQPDLLLYSLLNSTANEKEAIVRLWITEGIPFAFRNCPIIYEQVRAWLAEKLGINEREVTIIGSARTGYSLSSYPKYGVEYNAKSDLDFSIISSDLFDRLVQDFNCWLTDYSEGSISPRNGTERKYWDENKIEVPRHINRGFIDSNKVPYTGKYINAQNMGQTIYLLSQKIKLTQQAPKTEKVSIRIYQNWKCFIRQLMLNVEYMLKSFNKTEIHSGKYLSEVSASLSRLN